MAIDARDVVAFKHANSECFLGRGFEVCGAADSCAACTRCKAGETPQTFPTIQQFQRYIMAPRSSPCPQTWLHILHASARRLCHCAYDTPHMFTWTSQRMTPKVSTLN